MERWVEQMRQWACGTTEPTSGMCVFVVFSCIRRESEVFWNIKIAQYFNTYWIDSILFYSILWICGVCSALCHHCTIFIGSIVCDTQNVVRWWFSFSSMPLWETCVRCFYCLCHLSAPIDCLLLSSCFLDGINLETRNIYIYIYKYTAIWCDTFGRYTQ